MGLDRVLRRIFVLKRETLKGKNGIIWCTVLYSILLAILLAHVNKVR